MPTPISSDKPQPLEGQTRPSNSASASPLRTSNAGSDATALRATTGGKRAREPAVAGSFYPSAPDALRSEVESLLAAAAPRHLHGLRALICPHAGYRYSGAVAASGYKQVVGQSFERVVILAPSHRVAFTGVAFPDVDALDTPLGRLEVNAEAKAALTGAPFVVDDAPHAKEHSLEVQLPFLQVALGQFSVVPLVYGNVDNGAVAKRLDPLVDAKTLFIASSDLSHYYPYETAVGLDRDTVQAILKLDLQAMQTREACGKAPILSLMQMALARHWKPTLLDLRNSGDTAGDRSRVVGYATIAFTDMP